ncbi:MAG: hypothetical protein RLZZ241_1981 [Bacteroidota bacterium]|jgi:hypothetical protein
MSQLHIRFKKVATPILECIRQDGTRTWQKSKPGMVPHDLAHYVVETHLGFTKGFYGLLADGWDIEDFEKPKVNRPLALWPQNLPAEALITEHLVNIVLTGLQPQAEAETLFASFGKILIANALDWPDALDMNRFKTIQNRLGEILHDWHSLKVGEQLELTFPVVL